VTAAARAAPPASGPRSGRDQSSAQLFCSAPHHGLITESRAPSGSNGRGPVQNRRPEHCLCLRNRPESELPRIAQFREAKLELPGPGGDTETESVGVG
jgi:hypothetical protein